MLNHFLGILKQHCFWIDKIDAFTIIYMHSHALMNHTIYLQKTFDDFWLRKIWQILPTSFFWSSFWDNPGRQLLTPHWSSWPFWVFHLSAYLGVSAPRRLTKIRLDGSNEFQRTLFPGSFRIIIGKVGGPSPEKTFPVQDWIAWCTEVNIFRMANGWRCRVESRKTFDEIITPHFSKTYD